MPLTRVILFQVFPPDKRGLAVGITALGFSFGPMIGPVVSGYLLEYASWRAIFYLNVPVGLLSLGLAYVILPISTSQPRRPFDVVGCVSMAVFLSSFLLAVTQGRKVGWDASLILMLFALALGAAITFVMVELRSRHPFVELRLYKNVTFAMASIVNFLNTLGFMATNFIVALFLQQYLGYTPLQAAWMLMPSAVLVGIMSVAAGRLSDIVPAKFLVISGLGLVAGCLCQFTSITAWTRVGLLTFWLTVRGFARAFIMAPLNAASMAALHESEIRMGAGLRGFGRGLASASSVALAATWLQGRRAAQAQLVSQEQSLAAFGRDELLPSLTLTFERLGDVGQIANRKALAMLNTLIQKEAALHSYHETFAIIGVLTVIAILPALWMGTRAKTEAPDTAAASTTSVSPAVTST